MTAGVLDVSANSIDLDELESFFAQSPGAVVRMNGAKLCAEVRRLRELLAPPPVPLTRRQREVLEFVVAEIDERGIAPTFAEISMACGFVSDATIHEHLENLERKGWIERRHAESRSIIVKVRP